MLPKKYKLDSREVKKVMVSGKTLFSDLFLLKFLDVYPENTQNSPKTTKNALNNLKNNPPILKISVIAPKKPFNTAVIRNRVKRMVYNAIKPQIIEINNNLDPKTTTNNPKQDKKQIICALVCNKKIETTKNDVILAEIKHVFKKGGIINQL
jgi:ribonuclease P protein component